MKHLSSKNFFGFTLIELMVVIVILGTLATIGASSFFASQKKARDSRRKQELSQIARSLEMYYNDVGAYPAGASGTIVGCKAAADLVFKACNWGTPFQDLSKGTVYMVKLPQDPSAGQTYYYISTGGGYRLYARLENTEGPDADIPTTGNHVYETAICFGLSCNAGYYAGCCNYVQSSQNLAAPNVL